MPIAQSSTENIRRNRYHDNIGKYWKNKNIFTETDILVNVPFDYINVCEINEISLDIFSSMSIIYEITNSHMSSNEFVMCVISFIAKRFENNEKEKKIIANIIKKDCKFDSDDLLLFDNLLSEKTRRSTVEQRVNELELLCERNQVELDYLIVQYDSLMKTCKETTQKYQELLVEMIIIKEENEKLKKK